ncbi:hypothetical protein CIW83_19850 [Tissierella sp. P1]|uniref:hypothetical protein n=1 Tax=Tissierella TaxID=41273 RepID=UPI000BA0C180|nr:hypothetical protein [Tissierella sp. P1]MDU5079644.1 hypothetical protein [Bacillota bacterium]OZV10534.1 hypothetical protein CIW83_19850 [Tissierella sp. P1]
MKHYDYVEWVLYKNNLLDKEIHRRMEEHLLLCDECMEIFLSLIDEQEMENVGAIIPEDFTVKVLDSIKNITPIKKPIRKTTKKTIKKKVSNDFFVYYAAVASVAVILTATGFFGRIVDTVPQISSNVSSKESRFKASTIYDLTEEITNRTSKFINNFQFRIGKED